MPRRVLLIDDSITVRRALQKILLELKGYEIIGMAGNGAEGIKLFQQQKPDLVLMDIVMPLMGGIECLRALKSIDSEVPVVMISSVGKMERKVNECLQAGARSVLNKPIVPSQVQLVLEQIFGEEPQP